MIEEAIQLAEEWYAHWTKLGEYKLAQACRDWAGRMRAEQKNR